MQGQDIGQPLAPARIETTANSLDLFSTSAIAGAHGIFLDELNAVALTSVLANHGDIDLTAGGTITATLVRINTGPRALTLTATDGDIIGTTIQQLTFLFGGTVTLNAEDNITLGPGSLIQSLGIPFAGVGGTIFLKHRRP
jgi:hypothetical protein